MSWILNSKSADYATQIPYLEEFIELFEINEYPNTAWKLKSKSEIYAEQIPYKEGFAEMPLIDDVPGSAWVLDKENDVPYKKAFPTMYDYLYEVPKPIYQPPYVCAYDMHHAQDGFDTNGMCILCPSLCEITEELNGEYELTLEHPFDKEGRWKSLLELNIIKANGQLFRIYSKNTKMASDGSKLRTVQARHIFYDLNDKLLLDVRPENKDGLAYLKWIMDRIYDDNPDGYYPEYKFIYDSDITDTSTAYYIGTSVTGALLGEDNCFVNRLGGEIHRDNFYFSINKQKETAKADSFSIKYGVDMIEIEENIDYSEMMTSLIAKDNFGNKWEVYYTETMRLHHPVTRSVTFDYETENKAVFQHDAEEYFRMYCQPSINYKVTFANLKNSELYKDFIGLQECNVGDTGLIYCEELGISTTQKIVRKTIDVLTQSTVEVELGNLSSSLTRRDKFGGTIRINNSSDKAAAAAKEEARKAILASLKTWEDGLVYTYESVKGTWEEAYKEPRKKEEDEE